MGRVLVPFLSASEIFTLDCHNPCKEVAASQFSLDLHKDQIELMIQQTFFRGFCYPSRIFFYASRLYCHHFLSRSCFIWIGRLFFSFLLAFGISLTDLVTILISLLASFFSPFQALVSLSASISSFDWSLTAGTILFSVESNLFWYFVPLLTLASASTPIWIDFIWVEHQQR